MIILVIIIIIIIIITIVAYCVPNLLCLVFGGRGQEKERERLI